MARKNTKLEAEGAEFLVLGNLLVEGLHAYKMYVNMPGYDVLAVNQNSKKLARISVKSRWRVGAEGFIIKNFESDFVVVVKLNRGAAKPVAPEFFVIPTTVVSSVEKDAWGKMAFSKIPDFHTYRERWDQIRKYLGYDAPNSGDLGEEG